MSMSKVCTALILASLSTTVVVAQSGSYYGQTQTMADQRGCSGSEGPCAKSASDPIRTGVTAAAPATGFRQDATVIRVDERQNKVEQSDLPTIPDHGNSTMSLEPPSAFQQFVEASIGARLPLFGYDLFQNVPSTFAPVDHIAVPANYVIGPGDELSIRAWGQIDIDARVVVDRNGQIYLPKVGAVSVAGVSYDHLHQRIKSAVEVVFHRFELQVTLGQLRSIQIYVVGYARRPGAYTVSSLSTLVNALFASGGPSVHGSMRHIEVRRANNLVATFDMYDLLLKGDKSKDIVLQPGDVIRIPAIGAQVAVAGSVNLPAIYELSGNTSVSDGLEIAGGLTSIADGERVSLERVEGRATRKVEEFTLDGTSKERILKDGDLVRVYSIAPQFNNAVTLRGNVASPGRYPFRSGMKIRDLIPNQQFLLTRSYWNNHNELGNQEISSEWRNSNSPAQELAGDNSSQPSAIRKQNAAKADWHNESSAVIGQGELRTDVKRNAPDINWDYAVIQRMDKSDLSSSLIPFNLRMAILENDETANLPLQPGDVVTIFSQHDIAVSGEHQSKYVRLEGEFVSPGVYKVNPGETLRSLVTRVGGLTDQAFVFGSEFKRDSAQKQQQANLDQMVRTLEMESRHRAVYQAANSQQQEQSLAAQAESERSLIDSLRQLKATGRIVLEIAPSQRGVNTFPDIALEDGDSLVVPRKPTMVSVVGAVYNQNSLIFKENRTIADYLKISGGGTRDADMKHMFLIRADGSVLSKTNTSGIWSGGLDNIKVVPGDTIVIPARVDKGSSMRALKDWSQVIGQFGLGVAAINVLR